MMTEILRVIPRECIYQGQIDGGVTWRDVQINDHNFKPTPIGGFGQGYQGDNICLSLIK